MTRDDRLFSLIGFLHNAADRMTSQENVPFVFHDEPEVL